VFRQVVAYRWADGLTDDAKDAFREAFAGLRQIPELTSLRFADDAGHFEGNFDAVAVMDFPDFAAARRYVADERHQSYIRDFASKMIGERVVVQHDWAAGSVAGIHHVTLPVSDVERSRDWYGLAFGLEVLHQVTGPDTAEITMAHPSVSIELVLRRDPLRAQALAGFNALSLVVGTIEDLNVVVERLDAHGIAHGQMTSSSRGQRVEVADPDGLVVQLTTLLPGSDTPS
jgi:catechol 2,3-dioxygenase-like lactoylglutathione lyase family enzyme